MISLICFILTLAGSINWFCIGVLQYDFVAGLFGSQANIFSRIVYALIGLSSIWLIYALIKGKGKIKIDGKRSTDKALLGKQKRQAAFSETSYQNNFNGFNGQTNYDSPNHHYNPNFDQHNNTPNNPSHDHHYYNDDQNNKF